MSTVPKLYPKADTFLNLDTEEHFVRIGLFALILYFQ